MKIVASAPGKVVVTGEYAVLAGAPALVAAVDRRVSCRIGLTDGATWHVQSRGFVGSSAHPFSRLLDREPLDARDPARMCQCIVHALEERGMSAARWPGGLSAEIDSTALYERGEKLGLGSSAAVAVALTAAMLTVTEGRVTPSPTPSVTALDSLSIMLDVHARAQGGRGSGLDVATSHHGGLVRFRRDEGGVEVSSAVFPPGLYYAVVSVGAAAVTSTKLASFDAWRAGGSPDELSALCEAACRAADAPPEAETFVRELRAYVKCLSAMDDVGHFGIFSPPHRALGTIASAAGATYKPCGAGGGDIGMAFATQLQELDTFVEQARAAGFHPLPLELTQHGVAVRTES